MIRNIEQIDRGYEQIDTRLRSLGCAYSAGDSRGIINSPLVEAGFETRLPMVNGRPLL